MSKRNFTDRILNTELIPESPTRDAIETIDSRIKRIERRADSIRRNISEPCDSQTITYANGLTLVPKWRAKLITRGNPVEIGFKVNQPPSPFTFSFAGNGSSGVTLQLYRDDVYIDAASYSFLEDSSANAMALVPFLPRFCDLECPAGGHAWTVKASIGTSGDTLTLLGIHMYAYEVG